MRKTIVAVLAACAVGCGSGSSTTVTPSSTPPADAPDGGSGVAPGGGGPTTPPGGGGGGVGGSGGTDGGVSGGGGSGGSGGTGGGGSTGGPTAACPPLGAPVVAGGLTWSHEATNVPGGAIPSGALWQPAANDIYARVQQALVHSAGDGCWSPVAIPGVDSVIAVGGTGSADVYVVGASGGNAVVAHSGDGGHAWTTRPLAGTTPSRLTGVAAAGTTAWVTWDDNQAALRSDDDFATMQALPGSRDGGRLFAGGGALFDYGTDLVGRTCTIDRSSDGGQTWQHLDGPFCATPFHAGIDAMSGDGAQLWALGTGSGPYTIGSALYRSVDGGLTWAQVDTGLTLGDGRALWQAGGVVYAAVDHVIAQTWNSQTIGERVVYSTDGGAHFAALLLPTDATEAPVAVSGSGAHDVLVLEPDGTVWHGR